MKFTSTKTIKSSCSDVKLMEALEEAFRPISDSVKVGRQVVEAKSIHATFGSINRTDSTEITLRQKPDGWLVSADTDYKPSVWFWVFLVLGLFSWIGWLIPIGIYLYHKTLVKNGVTEALSRVNDELEDNRQGIAGFGGGVASGDVGVASQIQNLSSLVVQGLLTKTEFEAAKRKLLGLGDGVDVGNPASSAIEAYNDSPLDAVDYFTDDSDEEVFVNRDGKVSKAFKYSELASQVNKLRPTDRVSRSKNGPWVAKDDFFL